MLAMPKRVSNRPCSQASPKRSPSQKHAGVRKMLYERREALMSIGYTGEALKTTRTDMRNSAIQLIAKLVGDSAETRTICFT